jgi:addiction module HigA family antidote
VLRDAVLPVVGLSPSAFAARLAVSRAVLTALLSEQRDLSTALALRIARVLGQPVMRWIAMQVAFDLWRLANQPNELPEVEPMPPPASR